MKIVMKVNNLTTGMVLPFPIAGDTAEHGTDLAQARRFAQDAVHFRRNIAVTLKERAPAGKHNDGRSGGLAFDSAGYGMAVHHGHAQIRDDDVERVFALF